MNETIIHTQFSIYKSIHDKVPMAPINLSELHGMIVGANNPSIQKMRGLMPAFIQTGDKTLKKTINNLKASLPAITPSGIFGGARTNDGIGEYNGICQIDVDIKHIRGAELAEVCKLAISKLPFVSVCAISPTGYGVKGLAHTSNRVVEHHGQAQIAVNKVIQETINSIVQCIATELPMSKIVDDCGAAVSQPMYVPVDDKCFFNSNPVELDFIYVAPVVVERTFAPSNLSVSEEGQARMLARYVNKHMLVPGTNNSTSLIGFANAMGIDRDVLADFMVRDCWANDDIDRIDYIYRKYASQFGSKGGEIQLDAPLSAVEQLVDAGANRTEIVMVAGQRLSDALDTNSIVRNTHIIAPTGSGKSHLEFSGKQVWVFPTTSLCAQFWHKRGQLGRTVFGGGLNPDGDAGFIITTYDSCSKAMKGLNVSEYTMVLDEVHHYVVSSSKGYKLDALRSTLPMITCAKKVITLTATPFANNISEFRGFDVVNVVGPESFSRNVCLIKSAESRRADVVRAIKDRGNFSMIFLQTTDRAVIHSWEKSLNAVGKEVAFLNSKTKDEEDFKSVIDGVVDLDKVYIATSVIAEGVSVDETEIDVVDVYFVGAQHPYLIEQVSRRFRKINKLNVLLLTNDDEGVEEEVVDKSVAQIEISSMKRREHYYKVYQKVIDDYEHSGYKLSDVAFEVMGIYEVVEPLSKTSEWFIDELFVENKVFRDECSNYAGNIECVIEALATKYKYEIGEWMRLDESAVAMGRTPINSELVPLAKELAIDAEFGYTISLPDDDAFLDTFDLYRRAVNKILGHSELKALRKLGRDRVEQLFNDFDIWGDKASSRFIKFVKGVCTGMESRAMYQDFVLKYCVDVDGVDKSTLEQVAGLMFDELYLNATSREKMEVAQGILLCYEWKRTNNKNNEKVYKFKPIENRIKWIADLIECDVHNYGLND